MIQKTTLALVAGFAVLGLATSAQAKCLNKAAIASSGDAKSAKWFALETMVQSVSWGIWPAFVANGSTPGYRITKQRYQCEGGGVSVTCKGWATFCPTGKK